MSLIYTCHWHHHQTRWIIMLQFGQLWHIRPPIHFYFSTLHRRLYHITILEVIFYNWLFANNLPTLARVFLSKRPALIIDHGISGNIQILNWFLNTSLIYSTCCSSTTICHLSGINIQLILMLIHIISKRTIFNSGLFECRRHFFRIVFYV